MRNMFDQSQSSFSHRSHAGPSSGAALIGADEDPRGHQEPPGASRGLQGPPGAGNYWSGPAVKPFHRTFPVAPWRAAEVVLGGGGREISEILRLVWGRRGRGGRGGRVTGAPNIL